MKKEKAWFEEWFDSPFYHILYGHHDDREARELIQNLIDYLNPSSDSVFLDLACGKGRHSRVLNELGFETYGIDLSPNSIESASQHCNERLHFTVHDMREVYKPASFDYVLNLFTSFGYFDDRDDLIKTLHAVYHELKPGGTLVIDYLNIGKIRKNLGDGVKEVIERDGIEFHTEKQIKDGFVEKEISFRHKRGRYHYTERVAALDLPIFRDLLQKAGFSLQTIAGDYQFTEYNEDISDRLILVATKL